jgi:hypothetical protein
MLRRRRVTSPTPPRRQWGLRHLLLASTLDDGYRAWHVRRGRRERGATNPKSDHDKGEHPAVEQSELPRLSRVSRFRDGVGWQLNRQTVPARCTMRNAPGGRGRYLKCAVCPSDAVPRRVPGRECAHG